ncbi:MAG TPA: bifunctional nicotinamide-nucleotide adenylyltransferase/Nudix hydroxylase, partial [Thermoflexales bacterium]|nr:bifunctional nicotinamide-nucleotide adenylyltransferase/Nudix hydroxylase [Thermoflexales bacterium]
PGRVAMKYQFVVVIGRFQPFHNAHRKLFDQAFDLAERVIVVLGSHRAAPTVRNPWSSAQREEMMRAALPREQAGRVAFIPIRDWLYNESMWSVEVQTRVREIAGDATSIAILGHFKDTDSLYLRSFPQWDFVERREHEPIRAVHIRESYFRGMGQWRKQVPPEIAAFMDAFAQTAPYTQLCEEQQWVDRYKRDWAAAPYPPIFVTTDAVVHKSGHVLVVRRRGYPGKGLMALPGGFVSQDETLERSMLRELREETGLQLPVAELRKYVRATAVFDHPDRSLRGRTITHGFYVNLGNTGELPQVKGGDDAERAWWMPLADVYVNEERFFEDHVSIITHFVNRG